MKKVHIGFIALLLLLPACSNDSEHNNDSDKESNVNGKELGETTQEAEKEELDGTDEIPADTDINSFTLELKGIEKFYVQNGIRELHSLLKYKKDKRYLELEEQMSEHDIKYPLVITVLDQKNGYLEYAPMAAEVTYTMAFWNKSNGEKLIATTTVDCGPVCFCKISFTTYNEKKDEYSYAEPFEIIPEMEKLNSYFEIPSELADDPHEFMFFLPKKGKNIKYCINYDSECIELVWKDGIFKIKQ